MEWLKRQELQKKMISYYRDMRDDEYERLKSQCIKRRKIKIGHLKYHPSYMAQRKMMKEFQNKAINDIFIPNSNDFISSVW